MIALYLIAVPFHGSMTVRALPGFGLHTFIKEIFERKPFRLSEFSPSD